MSRRAESIDASPIAASYDSELTGARAVAGTTRLPVFRQATHAVDGVVKPVTTGLHAEGRHDG